MDPSFLQLWEHTDELKDLIVFVIRIFSSLLRSNTGTGNETYSFSFLQMTLLAQTSLTQNSFLPNFGFIDSFKSHFSCCQIKTLLCNQNTKCCFGFSLFLDPSPHPVLCWLWCQAAPSSPCQESPNAPKSLVKSIHTNSYEPVCFLMFYAQLDAEKWNKAEDDQQNDSMNRSNEQTAHSSFTLDILYFQDKHDVSCIFDTITLMINEETLKLISSNWALLCFLLRLQSFPLFDQCKLGASVGSRNQSVFPQQH